MLIKSDVFTPYFLFYNYNNLDYFTFNSLSIFEKNKKSEWDRIKEYGNKINDETKKKTLKKMGKFLIFCFLLTFSHLSLIAMEKKPYHHLPDGTFRNPEGSPERDPNIKWSYKVFNEERKKSKLNFLMIMLCQELRF